MLNILLNVDLLQNVALFFLFKNSIISSGRLYGIVVSTSDCHPRVPGSIPSYTLEIFLEV